MIRMSLSKIGYLLDSLKLTNVVKFDTMDVATVQAALDVLRSVVYHTIPDSAKVDLLRQTLRSEADGLSAEDLARLVVDHYLMESKARTKTATAGSEPFT